MEAAGILPTEALWTYIVLVVVAFIYYGPWQEACTDVARQMIFERRDRIFDLACEGKLQFESHEYKTIRLALNGMLRFAHELTWPALVVHWLMVKGDSVARRRTAQVNEAIDSISDLETREKVRGLMLESVAVLICMMLAKSFVALPALFVCVGVTTFSRQLNKGIYRMRQSDVFAAISERTLRSSIQYAELA
jgi:hypothetical protein